VGAVARVAGGESACGIPGGCGGVEVARVAGWLRDGNDEFEGSEKQPLSCVICLFLAITAARLLVQVASL
jgi:hypothetical protein